MKILMAGFGNVGTQVFDALVRIPGKHSFLVTGRNVSYLEQRSNLSVFAAMQEASYPEVQCAYMDVQNIERTAETIFRFQPDIMFCSIAIQPWMKIAELPKPIFEALYLAQAGPWLPMTLAPTYMLMQAVQQSGIPVKVINGSYPDSVNAILGKVNLAPLTGIGNLANNIPAIRKAIALKLRIPVEEIDISFVAHHYTSHSISRYGNSRHAPFALTVCANGVDVTHLLDLNTVFDLLPTKLKRVSGQSQLLTVASAMTIFHALMRDQEMYTHAPGPQGLVGGYPVRANGQGVEVMLPSTMNMQHAIDINEDGQRLDGIERIDEDGIVYFAQSNMTILKQILAYNCERMPLAEVQDRAKELQAKFHEVAERHDNVSRM